MIPIEAMLTILLFVLQWGMLGIIILYNKIENRFSYWYAGLIFALSLGVLCEIVRAYIAPASVHKEAFELIARLLSAMSYRFCAYFALLAGIEMYYETPKKVKINMILDRKSVV
jgi:MFS-type transporter involved in bile tolerance (Atg22 family)